MASGRAASAGCGPRCGLRITKRRSASASRETSFSSLPIAAIRGDTPSTVKWCRSAQRAGPFPPADVRVNQRPPRRSCKPRCSLVSRIRSSSLCVIASGSTSTLLRRACRARRAEAGVRKPNSRRAAMDRWRVSALPNGSVSTMCCLSVSAVAAIWRVFRCRRPCCSTAPGSPGSAEAPTSTAHSAPSSAMQGPGIPSARCSTVSSRSVRLDARPNCTGAPQPVASWARPRRSAAGVTGSPSSPSRVPSTSLRMRRGRGPVTRMKAVPTAWVGVQRTA